MATPLLTRKWDFGDLITAKGGNGVVLVVLYGNRVICLEPKDTNWEFGQSAKIEPNDWRKVDATPRTK